jgi:5-oxoprolinase (ATP-hydrolysing)
MAGGLPGERGLNLVRFAEDGRTINLGGKNTISLNAGDTLTIFSPGGGGYGDLSSPLSHFQDTEDNISVPVLTSGSLLQYSLNQESV